MIPIREKKNMFEVSRTNITITYSGKNELEKRKDHHKKLYIKKT